MEEGRGINTIICWLPDPVTAQAHMSLPNRAIGMVAACIGVGFSKFNSPNAWEKKKMVSLSF